MIAAIKKSFGKKFRSNAEGNFIQETDLGPELTEENCSAELWQELKSNDDPFDLSNEADGNQAL